MSENWSGALVVSGTGTDTCFIYDSAGKMLGVRQTDQEIELFPGAYSAKLYTMERSGTVSEGATTSLVSHSLTVARIRLLWEDIPSGLH